MAITIESFGRAANGTEINLYSITNQNGAVLKVSDMGAVWVSMIVPDKDGNMTDVVLGYESGMDYEKNKWSGMGAIIGRNANRIGGYRFTLNGKEYILANNARGDNLHSGPDLYISRLWKAEPVTTELGEGIEFSLFSPHMDQGFPGNLNLTVSYILTEDNSVIIEYSGMSDMDTIVNLTNHAYFNLAGQGNGTIEDELLWIDADYYTRSENGKVTTGELYTVEGTPMDFRQLKRIRDGLESGFETIKKAEGYDHNYCLKTDCTDAELVAKLVDEKSGIVMDVFTNLPGMQLYTGNYLWPEGKAKYGKKYTKKSGIALETQFYPDAINHPNFPSPIVKANETFSYSTIYAFSVLED